MKVAFVTSWDARDIRSWSGLGYFIVKALRDAGVKVDLIGPVDPPLPSSVWVRRILYKCFSSSTYLYERDPRFGRAIAGEVARRIGRTPYDIVFSIGGHPIAYLETDRPIVYWSDATFQAMIGFYPDFLKLSKRSERDGNSMEAAALRRARVALFASDWAARSAIVDYGVTPGKVRVVPFGANLETAPSSAEALAAIDARSTETCHLLFVGFDWERKGGDFAVKTAQCMNALGVSTQLTVVGCSPTLPEWALRFTHVRGKVDKASPGARAELHTLFRRSHFLILPTRAECYGVVFCEANSHGVPCLTTKVGGVPTIVRQDVNGRMFDLVSSPSDWASYAVTIFRDGESYRELAQGAYAEYTSRLNWGVSATTVRGLLEELI